MWPPVDMKSGGFTSEVHSMGRGSCGLTQEPAAAGGQGWAGPHPHSADPEVPPWQKVEGDTGIIKAVVVWSLLS